MKIAIEIVKCSCGHEDEWIKMNPKGANEWECDECHLKEIFGEGDVA